jgi:hypothetical protein
MASLPSRLDARFPIRFARQMKAWDMDDTRFDSLIRSLHDVRSRRAALATLLSGALAVGGGTAVAAATRKAKRCRKPGRGCRHDSKGATQADCHFCCGRRFRKVSKTKGRCCNGEGGSCGTNEQCCLGVCIDGTCQADVVDGVEPGCVPYGRACTVSADCCGVTSSGIGCLGEVGGSNRVCRFP